MAETLIENQVCNSCGAEVRPDTLFCYNCGSSVAPEVVVALKDKKDFTAATNFANGAEKTNGAGQIERAATEEANASIAKPDAPAQTELKSAAALRRKPKVIQPKRVEIVWEEHEASNGWFVFAAIVLILFAAGLFWLAMYLK